MHAAVGRFDGSLTVLMPHLAGPDGRQNPGYRDLFPEPPPAGLVPSCAEAGVLGALTGVIGTLQAMETIKLIAGIGEPLVGRLLLYDGLGARFDTVEYRRRTDATTDAAVRPHAAGPASRPTGTSCSASSCAPSPTWTGASTPPPRRRG